MRHNTKYGTAFALISGLLVAYSLRGGLFYALLWPAVSFGCVSMAYFGLGTRVFGKTPNGKIPLTNTVVLLPFLVYLAAIWHLSRLLSREQAIHQLTDSVFIGRRLMSSERPAHFDHVVDLTCEFTEPKSLRSKGYVSFPTLDGHFPTVDVLCQRAQQIQELKGTVYIHCAQGHGRTATHAIAYLLWTGQSESVEDAIEQILSCRPKAHLNSSQIAMLREAEVTGAFRQSPQ